MKKLVIGAAVALLLLPAVPAQAETINATAILGGGEEIPGVLTGAVGVANVRIDTDTRTIAVELRMFNIPTGTTAGHIHVGPKGVSGPVVVDFPIPPGRTGDMVLGFTVGSAQLRPNPGLGINSIDDVIQAIAGGGTYVNVHTSTFPAGEIRGQLTPN